MLGVSSRAVAVPRRWIASVGFVAVAAATGVVLAYAGSHKTAYAIGIATVVAVVVLGLADLRRITVLAVPASLVVLRMGGSISVSDAALFGCVLVALLFVRIKAAPDLRSVLAAMAAYELCALPAVLLHPYRADIVEWFHEMVLVGGGLVVGWVIGTVGYTRVALSGYLFFATALAAWTTLTGLSNGFQPVNLPYGLQKNFIGDMLAFAAFLAYTRPGWVGWRSSRWLHAALAVCLVGILASQSKQAAISLAIGVSYYLWRSRGWGRFMRRSKAVYLGLLPLVWFSYEVLVREFRSTNQFNSVHQRQSWLHTSLQIWHISPIFGVGLRWWYTNRFGVAFQPPNAEAEVLTTVGIVGLAGFLILILGAWRGLRTLPLPFASVALGVLLMRLVQGQLDLFWVGGQGAFPWLIAGIAIGAATLQRHGLAGDTDDSLAMTSRRTVATSTA